MLFFFALYFNSCNECRILYDIRILECIVIVCILKYFIIIVCKNDYVAVIRVTQDLMKRATCYAFYSNNITHTEIFYKNKYNYVEFTEVRRQQLCKVHISLDSRMNYFLHIYLLRYQQTTLDEGTLSIRQIYSIVAIIILFYYFIDANDFNEVRDVSLF